MLKHLTIAACSALVFMMTIGVALAAPCDITGSPSTIITHITSGLDVSYCELCGTGYVTIEISNPYDDDTDMTGIILRSDLGSSGLTFDSSASPAVEVDGVPQALPGATPDMSGGPSILVWTSGEIGELANLASNGSSLIPATLRIRFAVTRIGGAGLTHEGLISATRSISASVTYTAVDTFSDPDVDCTALPVTEGTGPYTLPLREPDPTVIKGGRNVDAAQTSYESPAYGNDKDDIIWRVRVANGGDADLQDLLLDDVMGTGNFDINFICATEAAAETVAITNNGATGSTPAGCINVVGDGNSFPGLDIDDPFGYDDPGSDWIDVLTSAPADIFFVGKIPDAASGVGACTVPSTNTVSNVAWGCQSDTDNAPFLGPGGISATSGGSSPVDATATLSTESDVTTLGIAVDYIGYGSNPVTGAKGRVVITLTNLTGGTVTDLKLTNVLPAEYVVDSTFTPTIVDTGIHGYYPGLTDTIAWDNPQGTPLANTAPEFTLTSSEATNSGQRNLFRHDDILVVTFGIVLVREASYDTEADLDVITESSGTSTDPDHAADLDGADGLGLINTLYVDFEDFCTLEGPATNRVTDPSRHFPDPEDLDIQTVGPSGPVLDYILTDEDTLTLSVRLTNNGGHGADDYYVYVAFGQTMVVATDPGDLPTGCSTSLANRPPLAEWQDPLDFPTGATIIECIAPGEISAGGTRDLDFTVTKSDVPADITADDLTFRADVIGEIMLSDGTTRLDFPAIDPRGDGVTDRANNYTIDAVRARVMGFNLEKTQEGICTENNTPAPTPGSDFEVQIGEECTFKIKAGGWFGFQTEGYVPIQVRNVRVEDIMPEGQGYVYSDNPGDASTVQVQDFSFGRVLPAGLLTWGVDGDLAEGTLYWTFNDAGNYITSIDQWFELDMVSRILNNPVDPDPIDATTEPNKHADPSINLATSTFDVYFLVGDADEFDVSYEPSMTIYPPEDRREIELTITEPEITVEKRVCNASLNDCSVPCSGASCDNWVASTSEGDALNDYVYRITLTNEAASGGEDRAPAYDVVVTDTLDSTDLAYVLPLDSDGLDNDGDGDVDGADSDGEGSISDNDVKNFIPAVITFSRSNSTALGRIDPGASNSVSLYYRVDFDNDAAPEQTFTNSAVAVYDSLEWSETQGDAGNQSRLPRDNSNIAGARVYTSAAATADVVIIPIEAQPKRITDLANTSLVGSGTQGASIGEEVEYTLNTLLPVALLRSLVIRDVLPEGMRCSEAPVLDLRAGGPYDAAGFDPGGLIAPTCTDDLVEWDFSDQRITRGTAGLGNRYDFEVSFIAQVENTADTDDLDEPTNGAAPSSAIVQYRDESLTLHEQSFGIVALRIDEPRIDLTKSFAVASADADDILTVTVIAANSGTATAYNLRVLDDLTGRNMTFTGTVGGTDPPDVIDTTMFGANQPVFSWSSSSGIAAGASISFTFDVQVESDVQPDEILDNTIYADWTSLPDDETALNTSGSIGADGSATGMRNGELPNAGDLINDYETSAAADTVVPAVVLTKTDLDPGAVPTIGAHKQFRIDIALPEGVTNDLIVTDSLDAAVLSYVLENNATLDITYAFQGIATINGDPADEAEFNAFPADQTTGSAVWDIGTVVTDTENDPTESAITPLIRIEYYARINNDAVTDAGDTLQNSVTANYTNGESGATEVLSDTTPVITIVEPSLAMAKALENLTSPGSSPLAGHTLRYTLTFTAAGGATFSDAHDLRIDDSLSLGLVYSGNPTVSVPGNTIAAPVETGDGVSTPQTLRWSLEDGNADITIAEGTVVTVTYEVLVDNSVLIGQTLTNSATAQWTSLDGASTYERNGTATPDYNDYYIGPVSTSDSVQNLNTTTKTRIYDTFDDSNNLVRIGDIVDYELRLGLQEGTHNSLIVTDTLPEGLQFEGIVSINGDTEADYVAAAPFVHADITSTDIVVVGDATSGPTTLTCTLGDVLNPADGNAANDDFVIVYRARVLNLVHSQLATIDLTNAAAMGYDTATGPVTGVTVSDTIIVWQPDLAVTKSASTVDGNATLDASELVTYTVDIVNSGTAPAYDTEFRDIIPEGMRNGAATITMVSMEMLPAGTALTALAPTYDPATGVATWDFDTGTANAYTIAPGDTLRIVYQAQAEPGLGPGMTLTNAAQVQFYYSFDDDDVPTRGSVTGVREIYGPSNTATTTYTTEAAGALDKANTVSSAAIGEPFSYRITVPATAQPIALHDVRITDDLSISAADLTFIRVTKISGSEPWTPVNTGSATDLVIEDTTVGIDIPAGEQIVVEITVMLADTGTNVTGLTFANTAGYTYNQFSDDPDSQADGGSDTTADMTIVGPDDLTMEKSGPATMALGTPGAFTLNVHNTGDGTAWNATITDLLPNEATGGTCDAGPSNITAGIYASDGTTLITALVEDTDYVVAFSGDPDCRWTLTLLSDSDGLPPDRRLIINYDLSLDSDTDNGATLTNIAGATQWFSHDPNAADAAPRTYTETLTDGTVTLLDHEDAHTVGTEAPVLDFNKHVVNLTTGIDPGLSASPGDTLRYTLEVINNGPVGLPSFYISDEVDEANTPPLFVADSLVLVSVPPGADTSLTDPRGGSNGTGLVYVDSITIGAQGDANDTVAVVFDITLVPVIDSGTVALNQAGMVFYGLDPLLSDNPNSGDTGTPTETIIASAPVFQVEKTSAYMTGDPTVLMAGETVRYTITIKNIGDENAVNATLRDFTPANTTYVAGSTTLNGSPVPDSSPGVNPLHSGILINAPEDTTPGNMRADTDPAADNVATVTFDVVVDADAMNGLVIENQGFVGSEGVGSGTQPEQPSDDPDTAVADDPTRDVVGNLPLLYAHKTVAISQDFGTAGIVDPGDVLIYTITISNTAAIDATGVVLTDAVPTNTTYVTDSLVLNGSLLAPPSDGGISPLIGGLTVESSDGPGAGIITAGESAVVTFEATVNLAVPTGTVISNQGTLTSTELTPQLTDADGLPANGYQPTIIVVGDAQLVTIAKAVSVVGGGPALAGGQLEYVITVANVGSVAATNVVLTDDLSPPLGTLISYVAGSGTLNGAAAGVSYAGSILTGDYDATYGDLAAGDTCVLRFRVLIDASVAIGTTITNTGVVTWNSATQTDSASVSIDVGGTPGSGTLNGNVWHDANLDAVYDSGELLLAGWSVALYQNSALVATVTTDASGVYQLGGLLPNDGTTDFYEIRFSALGAGAGAAALGYADSVFTDGPHRISDIVVASGDSLQSLNLPIQPNGTVYDSVVRVPVAGATLTMRNAATSAAVSASCFDDPNQQDQVTADEGYYKFDMNFSQLSCPVGGDYLIEVTSPASGYRAAPSLIIPPESDAGTAAFSVPACPGSAADAIPATPGYCEAVDQPVVPPVGVLPRTAGTRYYLHLMLSDGSVPGQSQIYNNPIPIDPEMEGATAITKTVSRKNVSRGTLVPYTITVTNVIGAPLYDIIITDRFPAGFKYVEGSARLNGTPSEPTISGRELVWDGLELQVTDRIVIQLLLVVGSGVSEGEYVNRAQVSNDSIGDTISGEASATVRVVPDPDFDCSDIVGKVFDDANLNGQQDAGEKGLAGVRLVTVRGLIATTDTHGRFHITCAAVPDEDRGSNFILKLDERSLPSGYRLTTENPRVQRATRGKMMRFRFGVTIQSVVRMDIADGAFEPDSTKLRIQWVDRIDRLIEILQQKPSILRLSYLGDVESKALVQRRLDALQKMVEKKWKPIDGGYPLTIETEVFWRRGASFKKR